MQKKKASADKDSAEQKAITDEATAEQKAITDEAATELKEQYALQTADWSNEYELHQEVHKGYVEVAKGQIPRSITRAEFIEKVATAISAIYIGIIGVTFALKDNLVPARGIVPSFFLGLSIVLAASYVAFLINSQKDESEGMLSDGTLTGKQYRRYNIFIRWNNSAVLSRRRALQSAVISLGFGLAYLPIPYIDMQPLAVWAFALVGLVLTVLLPFVIDPFWKK